MLGAATGKSANVSNHRFLDYVRKTESFLLNIVVKTGYTKQFSREKNN